MCSCSEPQRSNGDNAAQRRKAVQVRTQELVGGQLPLVASGRSQRPYQQGPYHGQQAEWPYNTAPPT